MNQREFFDRIARTYGLKWTIEEENRIVAARVVSGEERFVEVGCGKGLFLAETTVPTAIGIDFSEGMLREARRLLPERGFVLGDATRLPLRRGSVGTLVFLNVLHNQDHPEIWLRSARRGGARKIVVDFRNLLNPIVFLKTLRSRSRFRRVDMDYRPSTRWDFRRLLEKNGWRPVRFHPVIRPPADPNTGFQRRHLIGWLVSRIPGLAPTYVVEAVATGEPE
ncbi:MAG: class I SAM-dependent methyltransferase [Candidatus Hydrogenedentota bacterium]|nr:MAG: class I SAM-dependent methyltransferase [Candidatus Hydrogenedentota bacterium]